MTPIDRAISGAQLLLVIGLGFGAYYVYKKVTDPNGWGSVEQNGQRYSLINVLFATPSETGHIYDTTGSLGGTVSAISESEATGTGLTAYDQQLVNTPGFTPGIPGVSQNTR